MTDILALLQPIAPLISKTTVRQLSRVIFGILAMTGRVTMLGISRCLINVRLRRSSPIKPELKRIQTMLQALLLMTTSFLSLKYVVLDGHFGNYPAAWMVMQNRMHLVSKLRHDAGLY